MGTAEIPNALLVILFTGVALLAGAVLFSIATSAPDYYVKVPAGAALTGVAVFSASMVITCLAAVTLWLSVLVSLLIGTAIASWSIKRWHNYNYVTLAAARAKLSNRKPSGGPDEPQLKSEG